MIYLVPVYVVLQACMTLDFKKHQRFEHPINHKRTMEWKLGTVLYIHAGALEQGTDSLPAATQQLPSVWSEFHEYVPECWRITTFKSLDK